MEEDSTKLSEKERKLLGVDAACGARRAGPVRVLVVDDNKDAVSLLVALLEHEGFAARGVENGRDAMLELAEFDPDAIVSDLKMGGVSGWQLARAVRQVGEAERPLLIAVSGEYVNGSDKILTEMSGFHYFLSKPYDIKVLSALLAPLAGKS